MAIRTRSEIIQSLDTVILTIEIVNTLGEHVDLDSFPQITLVQPNGSVVLGPTSAGVYHVSTGTYAYDYNVGAAPNIGVWSDHWNGVLGGFPINGSFSFVIHTTQIPAVNSDGYIHLGDDVPFNYSQNALMNVNKLIKALKARLNSSGKSRTTDEFGNVIYENCDIYTVDQLATFVGTALTAFNEIPHFTFFSFEDTDIINQFFEVILQYAVLSALASKALIERGREFQISDNGVTFTPPGVSDLLNTQYNTELNNWFEKVKLIKQNMKPGALGIGTFRPIQASPQLRRLRHRRQGRFY